MCIFQYASVVCTFEYIVFCILDRETPCFHEQQLYVLCNVRFEKTLYHSNDRQAYPSATHKIYLKSIFPATFAIFLCYNVLSYHLTNEHKIRFSPLFHGIKSISYNIRKKGYILFEKKCFCHFHSIYSCEANGSGDYF